MMGLSLEQMIDILGQGGSLRIRSSSLGESALLQLADRAKGYGLVTIVVDSNLPPSVMVQIAAKGDGAVTFDLSEAS